MVLCWSSLIWGRTDAILFEICLNGFRNKADREKLGDFQMGKRKRPTVRPLSTSSAKRVVTIAELREAVGKFLESRTGVAGPSPLP